MGVISTRETWKGRTGDRTNKLARTYKRVFTVITDDVLIGPNYIINTSGVPTVNTPYFTASDMDAGALCVKVTPTQDEDPRVWQVTCEYSSDLGKDGDPAKQAESPLDRPPIWKFSFNKIKMPVTAGADGLPILNSALQPMSPPVEVDVTIPIISISVNKATFSYDYMRSIQDRTNQFLWNGFPSDTLKIANASVEEQYENGLIYWKLDYTIEVAPVSIGSVWRPTARLDQGYYELIDVGDDVPKQLRQIRDMHNHPVSAPVLLNGEGLKLTPGSDPVFLYDVLYLQADFTGLP